MIFEYDSSVENNKVLVSILIGCWFFENTIQFLYYLFIQLTI